MSRKLGLPSIESLASVGAIKTEPDAIEDDFAVDPFKDLEGGGLNNWSETGWISHFNLDLVLSYAIREGASDIHLTANKPVAFTVLGKIVYKEDFIIPDSYLMNDLVESILSHQDRGVYVRDLEYDTSYEIRFGRYKKRRFRVSVGKSFHDDFIVFRTISDNIPSPDTLDIDDEIRGWFRQSSGAILVCGPTGSGKALHKDTLIPTLSGMKKVGDIDINKDILFTIKKDQTKILERHNASKEDRFYLIKFSNGEEVRASGRHDWLIFNDKRMLTKVDTDYIYNNFEYEFVLPHNSMAVSEYMGMSEGERSKRLYKLLDDEERDIIYTAEEDKYLEISELASSLGYYVKKERGMLVVDKTRKNIQLKVASIELIEDDYRDYYCFEVEDDSHSYLIGSTFIVTHNSTTMASILREIQLTEPKKIITIEKPIEAVFPDDGKALVVQRAIPEDCVDFEYGLTGALRQNPDYILIGEVRNKSEVNEFLRAAETGHLAMSTIHTVNNVTTLNRIRSLFTGDEQKRILATLGDVLRGVVNQQLVLTKDGKSRFAVREFLTIDYKIRKLIAEDNFAAIRQFQEDNGLTMEQQLAVAVIEDRCTFEEARSKAPDVVYFDHVYQEYIRRG